MVKLVFTKHTDLETFPVTERGFLWLYYVGMCDFLGTGENKRGKRIKEADLWGL